MSLESATHPLTSTTFAVHVRELAGVVVVRLVGEATVWDVPELETQLALILEGPPRQVVFDLENLTFLSSHAIGVLIGFRRATVKNGGSVVLTKLRANVRDAFVQSRLDTLFEIM